MRKRFRKTHPGRMQGLGKTYPGRQTQPAREVVPGPDIEKAGHEFWTPDPPQLPSGDLVQRVGFRVCGVGCRVYGAGVQGLGCRV